MRAPETGLLADFSNEAPRLVWEQEKGEGFASPVIQDSRLFFMHRQGQEIIVECLDAETGRRHWQYRYPTFYEDRYGYNGGPRSSPALTKNNVYTLGPDGELHCLDLGTGRLRWKHSLGSEFGVAQNFFGVGSTPLVWGSLLIVQVGGLDRGDVAAFDLETGGLRWKNGVGWGASYATPRVARLSGKDRLLVFAGGESEPPTGGLLCMDPSTGLLDFSYPWRGRPRESVNASTPWAGGNQIFLSECYGMGSVLLEYRSQGIAVPRWTNRGFGIHFMSPLEKDGYLYGVDGHGPGNAFLVCIDLKDGSEKWRRQPSWEEVLVRDGKTERVRFGTYRSWLLGVDGRTLCLGEFGHLLWMDLSPAGVQILSRTWLFSARETWTPPVLSRGLLYVCQNQRDFLKGKNPRLLCYDLRGR